MNSIDSATQTRISFLHSLILLIFAFLFFGAVSVYLGQDANWDLKNYHYYNAYSFLNGRLGFDYGPAQLQNYLNPILDLPFYIFVKYLPPVWVGFLLGGIHGMNFWLLFEISHQVFLSMKTMGRIGLSFACAAVGMYGPGAFSLLGTTTNDLFASIFVLGSLLILVRGLVSHRGQNGAVPASSILYAGVLLGIGIGLKLTLVIYGIGLALSLLVIKTNWIIRLKQLVIWGISLSVGIIGSSGYWMLQLWENFGSPLFPFYNKILQSPYFECVNIAGITYLPKNLWEKLFYPFYFIKFHNTVMEFPFRDIRWAVLYLLLISAAVMMLWRRFGRRVRRKTDRLLPVPPDSKNVFGFLITFFLVSYILWQEIFAYYRYIIPLELLGPILIGVLLSFTIFSEKKRIFLQFILFMAIVFAVRSPNWVRLPWSHSFFGVKVPALEEATNPIVVMVGYEPTAYVIPFFPEQVRFVRVVSNFTNPTCKNKMQAEMQELLRVHRGPLYLLTRRINLKNDALMLAPIEIHVKTEECSTIPSRLDNDLMICRIEKNSAQQ
ncbi:MAG: hypothetical protein A2V86_15350 [Deltaproteobacteria bacterium RBG_16_49_23]|nr:MAG: hypothetical protein A2V86_15350 [Deltaproteobacteria bacterium RBG_16_49_23]